MQEGNGSNEGKPGKHIKRECRNIYASLWSYNFNYEAGEKQGYGNQEPFPVFPGRVE